MKSFNFNYTIRFFILLYSFFVLIGCRQKPENTVKKYLDYTFLNNNGKKAYRLLSSDDKKYKSEKDFRSEVKRKNVFNDKFLKRHKNHFSYKVLDTKYLGDTAIVKVLLTKPNTRNIVDEVITFTMSTSFSKMDQKERNTMIHEQFGNIVKNQKIETAIEEKEFTLIKENGYYKICLDPDRAHLAKGSGEQIKKNGI